MNTLKVRFLVSFLVLTLTLTLSTALPTLAQDTSAQVTYGTPVQGTIDQTTHSQNWTLQSASADRISVLVQRLTGNYIPAVTILDTNNQSIADSYGADGTGAAAAIKSFTLPAAGTYQIHVDRYNGDSGVTVGTYQLTVTPNATAEDNPNNTTPVGSVDTDTPVDGEVTATHWLNLYTYTAQAGDTIRITSDRTSGTLQPEVEVRDVNGASLTTGYVDSTYAEATIEYVTLPAAGTYTIVATRASRFNGETVGGFHLTVTMLGSGTGSPFLQGPAGVVQYDTALTGQISGKQWYQDWTLTAVAGDTITLNVQRTDGTLLPEVILLGAGSQEINHGYTNSDGATATVDRVQLTGPGTYTVRVSRYSSQNGLTTGGYSLTVQLIGSGAGSPNLTTPTGAITVGTPVTGQITNARWEDTWTFTATQGEAVTIKVARSDGTLVPMIEIKDTNGQSMNTAYPDSDTSDRASMDYTFSGNGQYTIVVERDRQQNGYTTGSYALSITKAG